MVSTATAPKQRKRVVWRIDDHVRDEHGRAQSEDNGADGVAFPAVAEEGNLGLVAEAFAQGPQAGADEENGERNHQAGGGGHKAINADALAVGLAGTAEDGEGGHVGGEEGEEKDHFAHRAAGQEKVLGAVLAATESGAADEGDQGEVDQDDEDGDHLWKESGARSQESVVIIGAAFVGRLGGFEMSGPGEFDEQGHG